MAVNVKKGSTKMYKTVALINMYECWFLSSHIGVYC